jgi:hypothetical protein
MRVYLVACVAIVILGAGGYFFLGALQTPSGEAYTTQSARVDPGWSWRSTSTASPPTQCDPREAWQWFFVDFHSPDGESGLCSYSQ